jgi:AcrR family transcriptional regulator
VNSRKRTTSTRSAPAAPTGGPAARRERIISVTRELIGELGIESITMRDLALRCDVAVATLYNQFGSREAIIAAALQSDFEGRYEPLSRRTVSLGPAGKLRERIGEAARAIVGPMRDYTRSVMFFYFHHKPDSTLRAAIHDFVAADFMAIAQEIETRGDLQPWVHVDTFADDLITQLYGLVMKWSQGYIPDRRLRSRLLHAATASFIGISRGRSRGELERLAAGTR